MNEKRKKKNSNGHCRKKKSNVRLFEHTRSSKLPAYCSHEGENEVFYNTNEIDCITTLVRIVFCLICEKLLILAYIFLSLYQI